MIGQTISHYKILEKLGEGGMGVVYRAHDTELDRDVALKFLPHDTAMSEEERSRFIHEAKAASALEHPNICTIHHVDKTSDGRMFIVMGYYEGRSISKMVKKGRLEVGEAISIAIQIAEGLQAAHEKGIVHRDIKSSNIIVSDRGQVRILDFGLARRKGLSRLTKTGTTVGTAMYMSPEQAQGESVDHRTDIWSLGVVLYEMVTGHVPFRGEHEAAVLYSVVNEQALPIEAPVSDASPEFVHIINRALEKDPAERYKTAEDMLIDLRRLKKETSRIGFAPARMVRKKGRMRTIAVAAVTAVALCVAVYYLLFWKGVGINVNYTQHTVDVPFNKNIRAVISPSGKWIVLSATDKNEKVDLYVVGRNGGTPNRITRDSAYLERFTGSVGHAQSDPSISPDEQDIVYSKFRKDGIPELCKVPLVGGPTIKIGEGLFPRWSRDGTMIGYIKYPKFSESKNAEFWTIRPDGSDNRREFIDTSGYNEGGQYVFISYYFDWSPDGRSVAWMRRTKQKTRDIVIHNMDDGREQTINSDATVKSSLCWVSNGMILYRSTGDDGSHLWMIPAVGGTPVQITRGMGLEEFTSSTSDGSVILFNASRSFLDLLVGKLDGSKPEKIATIEGEVHFWPDLSPQKNVIVFPKAPAGSTTYNLALIDRDGGNERWLTKGHRNFYCPTWSPDGQWIVSWTQEQFAPDDSAKLHLLNPWTMEPPRQLSGPKAYPADWIDDSVLVFVRSTENALDYQSMRLNIKHGDPVQIAADSIAFAFPVADNKFVLYQDYRGGNVAPEFLIVPMARWRKEGGIDPKVYKWGVPDNWAGGGTRSRRRFILCCDPEKGDLWKVWFPDARKERVLAGQDALKGIYTLCLSGDENTYAAFSRQRSTCSIAMIENLFR